MPPYQTKSKTSTPIELPPPPVGDLGPKCHKHGITGFGRFQPGGVCFIGIAPGEHEQFTSKRPLTGPSGQLLDSILEACEWPRELTYTTNLLCWWKNDPSLAEILACWPRLRDELALLRPKLIIPLGEIASDFLLGNYAGNLLDHTPSDWNAYAWTQIHQKTSSWAPDEEYFGFTSRRGRTSWSTALQAYVLPTYHTAGVLRGHPYLISDIIRDLQKIPTVINEFLPDGHEADYDYTVIQSVEEGNNLLQYLPRGSDSPISIDIETNYGRPDIDWFAEDLLCLSITSPGFPGDTRGSTAVIPGSIAKLLDWKLARDIWTLGQNLIFDSGGIRRWISNQGPNSIVDLPIREDTQFQSYALDERKGAHDLETIGGEWCAAPMWKSALAKFEQMVEVDVVDRFGTVQYTKSGSPKRKRVKRRIVPDSALWRYNAGDTTYTYRAHLRQRPRVTTDGVERVYADLLIPAANAFKEIQLRGMYIDQFRTSQLMVEWSQLWLDQEEELQRVAHESWPDLGGKKEYFDKDGKSLGLDWAQRLNFRSNPTMSKFLYEVLKLPPQYIKEKKKQGVAPRLTTNKDALEALAGEHPFTMLLHDWRQTDRMMTVATGILDRIKQDGMLHATPMLHGTETGRLSYQNPNLQNIAQDWMVGPNLARIREIFAPRNPETHFLLESDYKQVELWMAVTWSLDPQMQEDLDTGDFHRMTCTDLYSKLWDDVTEADRFYSKMVTFGRLYERGAEDLTRGRSSLRGLDGVSRATIPEAEIFIRKWLQRYRGYAVWAEKLKLQARKEGVIQTPWGRKRRYYLVMGDEAQHMLRSALNFCMQSTAHDYTLMALLILQKLLEPYDTYILVESHDAILFEVSIEHAHTVIPIIKEVMETVRPPLDNPSPISEWPFLKVDMKSGPNWFRCTKPCARCKGMYPFVQFSTLIDHTAINTGLCIQCEKERVQLAA